MLIDLSKGRVGEHNASLLGHIVMSMIWVAAQETSVHPSDLQPPVHIYVDEFQNAVGPSVSETFSEIRKFWVSLTVANQFTPQLDPRIASAIEGNIGTQVIFQLGHEDARLVGNSLGVLPALLARLPVGTAIVTTPDAVNTSASLVEVPLPGSGYGLERVRLVRARSMEQWGRSVAEVEAEIRGRWAHVEGSFADPERRRPSRTDRWLRPVDNTKEGLVMCVRKLPAHRHGHSLRRTP